MTKGSLPTTTNMDVATASSPCGVAPDTHNPPTACLLTPADSSVADPMHAFGPVDKADVAIFWDFENVHIPRWCSASRATEGIRNSVAKIGKIVEKRLYFDFTRSVSSLHRMELDLAGFTLVDCPSRNCKETLEKNLIVDVLCFVLELASRGGKACCVVIVTSDGDYSYVLARLRDFGVYTVVMY
eukprot:Nitzschia sp. Nitz4//scaffold52_size167869//108702//109256//NITZ4_002287-RA/size167869-processed-gene-0.103-mRNA-1//1//CDS//3329554068//8241//frame0